MNCCIERFNVRFNEGIVSKKNSGNCGHIVNFLTQSKTIVNDIVFSNSPAIEIVLIDCKIIKKVNYVQDI